MIRPTLIALVLTLAVSADVEAMSLADLINGGSIANGGLTFSNFTGSVTVGRPSFAAAGVVVTQQPTLDSIMVTSTSSTFGAATSSDLSFTGFQFAGTIDTIFTSDPVYVALTVTYDVRGLGSDSTTQGPRIINGFQSVLADPFHNIDVTTPDGRVTFTSNSNRAGGNPVNYLPIGATQASVRDTMALVPFIFEPSSPGNCSSHCSFDIVNDRGFLQSYSFLSGYQPGTVSAVPEPGGLCLMATGALGVLWLRRKKMARGLA